MFPPECPVFRVLQHGAHALKGAIVEGCEPEDYIGSVTGKRKPFGYIGVRIVSGRNSRNPSPSIHPRDGWYGLCASVEILEPLTPAAQHMLEVATTWWLS